MKINKFQNGIILNKKNKEAEKKVDKTPSESTGVKIEISNSAKELSNKINKHEDTGYSKRVEEIRKSIIEGKYSVSPDEIADKLVEAIISEKGSVK